MLLGSTCHQSKVGLLDDVLRILLATGALENLVFRNMWTLMINQLTAGCISTCSHLATAQCARTIALLPVVSMGRSSKTVKKDSKRKPEAESAGRPAKFFSLKMIVALLESRGKWSISKLIRATAYLYQSDP